MSLIVETLWDHLRQSLASRNRQLRILEFGSGDGFQIPYLKRMGDVAAVDPHPTEGLRRSEGISFHECGIGRTPFEPARFDLIFSNHVLEHIPEIGPAFSEMKRIGTPECLYAFSVLTEIWLLLSIPAQYYRTARLVWQKFFPPVPGGENGHGEEGEPLTGLRKYLYYLFPSGHGVNSNFFDCYRSFKIASWKHLFRQHGFSILGIKPLLLYAPSEWPIVPTTGRFSRWGLFKSG